MLKLQLIDFTTLLIGAEGAKTPAGVRGRGDTHRRDSAEEAPRTAREPHAPGAQINRQVSKNALRLRGLFQCPRSNPLVFLTGMKFPMFKMKKHGSS